MTNKPKLIREDALDAVITEARGSNGANSDNPARQRLIERGCKIIESIITQTEMQAKPTTGAIADQLRPIIAKLTQREVSARSGVPQSNISNWLAGKSTITVETLERICAACGVVLTADHVVGSNKMAEAEREA